MTVLPFGTAWPMHDDGLRDRTATELDEFQKWASGLDLGSEQQSFLLTLLDMTPASEFVEGSAACVTGPEELARRSGLGASVEEVLESLESIGLVTSHSADSVFGDQRAGIVVRVRKPDIVLSVEAAGSLWLRDSWYRRYLRAWSR